MNTVSFNLLLSKRPSKTIITQTMSEVHIINVDSKENDDLFLERVSILLFIFSYNNSNLNIFY